jgi:hypothetical protein
MIEKNEVLQKIISSFFSIIIAVVRILHMIQEQMEKEYRIVVASCQV